MLLSTSLPYQSYGLMQILSGGEVDESGLNLALTRLYARAPRGVRAVGSVPQNYGQSLTV
jgi:hypothetical protein